MADSKYYKERYEKYKKKVKEYEGQIKDLKSIKSKLSDTFGDEQRNVNTQIDKLQDNLYDAVRQDSTFNNTTDDLDNKKEVGTYADGNLNDAIDSIGDEIGDLERKKSDAEYERDKAHEDYKRAKDEEDKAKIEAVKEFFGIN